MSDSQIHPEMRRVKMHLYAQWKSVEHASPVSLGEGITLADPEAFVCADALYLWGICCTEPVQRFIEALAANQTRVKTSTKVYPDLLWRKQAVKAYNRLIMQLQHYELSSLDGEKPLQEGGEIHENDL